MQNKIIFQKMKNAVCIFKDPLYCSCMTIQEAYEKSGMNLQELSGKLGVSIATAWRIIIGKKSLKGKDVKALGKIFKLTPSWDNKKVRWSFD